MLGLHALHDSTISLQLMKQCHNRNRCLIRAFLSLPRTSGSKHLRTLIQLLQVDTKVIELFKWFRERLSVFACALFSMMKTNNFKIL